MAIKVLIQEQKLLMPELYNVSLFRALNLSNIPQITAIPKTK